MHVVATAGHVDHGKSTLVRALTGMEPDRWAEERRRGMTIDLGFGWAAIEGHTVAFVDVPGHERFVPNMLAGVGPVPAVLLVVAADEGWMPQTQEHVAALDALGVRHALAVVSRSDLADPAPVAADVVARVSRTSMGAVEAVAVSAVTGEGVADLRRALARLVQRLPAADEDAPVRLWVDRSFTIRGAGTVVTGTLAAGRLAVGDELELRGRRVGVRGLQSMNAPADPVRALARVAVNLRGVSADEIGRGDALLTPGAWRLTGSIDVRLRRPADEALAGELTLHVGSAAVPVRVRPLGADCVRLTLGRALPLAAGDVALLRDPGLHRIVAGVSVLDADPPRLQRRGAAAARACALDSLHGTGELQRRRITTVAALRALGVEPPVPPLAGDWLVDPTYEAVLRQRLRAAVQAHAAAFPLESGPTVEALRRSVDLPDRALVGALLAPPLAVRDGRVVDTLRPTLPPRVAGALGELIEDLRAAPYRAPEAARVAALGLGRPELAAAERAGLLLRIAEGVVLLPGADEAAAAVLAGLPQPFTLSEARQALGTTRRVAVPLLELLDRTGATRRLPDDRRVTVGRRSS